MKKNLSKILSEVRKKRIETNKKRHVENVKRYRGMSDEEKVVYVKEQKEKSRKKYKAIKDKYTQLEINKKELITAANEFFYKELRQSMSMRVLVGSVGQEAKNLVVVTRLVTGEDNKPFYDIAYTLKSPKDHFSLKKAIPVASSRLMPGVEHTYKFKIFLKSTGTLSKKYLSQLCMAQIRMDIVSGKAKVPSHILKSTIYNNYDDFVVLLEEVNMS